MSTDYQEVTMQNLASAPMLFPIFLHYQGHAELEYFADEQALCHFLEQQPLLLPQADQLIDSQGRVFVLDDSKRLSPSGSSMSLEQMTMLLQAHAFAQQESCITKLIPRSIAEAMQWLASQSD